MSTPYKTYTIAGKEWTVLTLAEYTGLSRTSARSRMIRWQNGEMDEDSVLYQGKLDPGGKKNNAGTEEWQSFSRRVRSENLAKIPNPTKYEINI